MSQPPVELYEQWSPTGERMARRARWGATVQGSLFLIDMALVLFGIISEHGFDVMTCLILLVPIGWGVALMARGAQIEQRRRGPTIAVMILSLMLSLVITALIARASYLLWQHGISGWKIDPLAWGLVILQFVICLSGYFAAWYCIQTLRHWPPRAGAAFQVEFSKPKPHDENASHER